MRKYLHLVKLQFSLIPLYRFDMAWRWMSNIIQFAVYTSLWSLTTSGNAEETRQIITYFALYHGILDGMITSRVASNMEKDISSGNINQALAMPISYPAIKVIEIIAKILARILVPGILLTTCALIKPDYFAPASACDFFTSVLFLLLGLICWNLFMLILGSINFWTTETSHLRSTIDLALHFFTGAYMPAYLFPDLMKKTLSYTPVPYFLSFPIDLYTGKAEPARILPAFVTIVFWITVLFVVFRLLYRRGLKIYEAFGS